MSTIEQDRAMVKVRLDVGNVIYGSKRIVDGPGRSSAKWEDQCFCISRVCWGRVDGVDDSSTNQ